MLNFNMRVGDDVWIGWEDQPLGDWAQIILNRVDQDVLTVLTSDSALDLDLSDDDNQIDVGSHQTSIRARWNPKSNIPGEIAFSIAAPDDVKILRGRKYRSLLSE